VPCLAVPYAKAYGRAYGRYWGGWITKALQLNPQRVSTRGGIVYNAARN